MNRSAQLAKKLENYIYVGDNVGDRVTVVSINRHNYYAINLTLRGPLVRALRARAGILLLINQRNLPRRVQGIILEINFSPFLRPTS